MLQDNNLIASNDFRIREILDLEKKYFNLLYEMLQTEDFQKDLLAMEEEIQDRYLDYEKVWNLKNKFDLPAERLVTHHIYKSEQFKDLITGMYTSAISSDIGVIVGDAILSIDVKTNDLAGNSSDYNRITAEKNQISFDNSNYKLIPTKSNLDSLSRYKPYYPILTYIVKFGYHDDNHSFQLVKGNNKYPTIQLACIPNGRLSELFDKDILEGFKTYKYSEEQKKCIYVEDEDEAQEKMEEIPGLVRLSDIKKPTYRNLNTGEIWMYTRHKKKNAMRVLTGGNTARINIEALKNRFDGNDNPWSGLKTIVIEDS